MRIAIDGRTITAQRTGVGEYSERLVRHLLQIDSKNEYFLFLIEPHDTLAAPNLTKVYIPGYNRMGLNRWWENILLPRFLQRQAIDIYFSPAFTLPLLPRLGKHLGFLHLPRRLSYVFNINQKVKYVVTVHDVIAFLFPEYFTLKMRVWTKLFVKNAVRLADTIITVSETTKRDLITLLNADPARIVPIHAWLDPKYAPVTDPVVLNNVRTRYNLPNTFILYVGTIEPRKNIAGIVRAHALLPAALQKEYPLIIGGGKGWYAQQIIDEIHSAETERHVEMIGYIAHEDLAALYSLASVLVFPSFYEGFGSPPLEAMACGTPAIVSDIPSLREAINGAAILVNPNDTSQIAEAIERVLTDKQLASSLRERGLERAKDFHWEIKVEELRRVLEDVGRLRRR
jgi:glycosyltransferase involved in cell wall biosynthesis